MNLNIMPIFWINTRERFPKRGILTHLLINWDLTALRWESNASKCPQFWALMYGYISMSSADQRPPVAVSCTTAAAVPKDAAQSGALPGTALMEKLRTLWVQHDACTITTDGTISEEDSLPRSKILNVGVLLCFPLVLHIMFLFWGLRMSKPVTMLLLKQMMGTCF